MTNLEKFLSHYKQELLIDVKKAPHQYYGLDRNDIEGYVNTVHEQMSNVIKQNGIFSIALSPAMKRSAKLCGVKGSYTAINDYIKQANQTTDTYVS